jgi:hypothetical protein
MGWGILCIVDRASLYNLVNKTNLVHNSFFVCLFLFSTSFRQLCAHHQEITSHHPAHQTVIRTVTNTGRHIDTIISPDDGHTVA